MLPNCRVILPYPPHNIVVRPIPLKLALEEAASQVGVDSSPWSAPKDTSSSLLEELAATVFWWRAVDFILRIYTNVYE